MSGGPVYCNTHAAVLRMEMRDWLADLEALRPFMDPDRKDAFYDAWQAAMARAHEAAERYAAEMAPPGDGA